jgi:hypothetical protein
MDSAELREAEASRQPPEAQPAASAAPGAHQCVLDLWIDGLLDVIDDGLAESNHER